MRPYTKAVPRWGSYTKAALHQSGSPPKRLPTKATPHQSGSPPRRDSPRRYLTKAVPRRYQGGRFLHQSGTHQGGIYQDTLHPTTQPTPQRDLYLSGISSHRHRTSLYQRRTRIKTPLTNPLTHHLTPQLINAGISLPHYIKHISLSVSLSLSLSPCHHQIPSLSIPSHPIPSHLSFTIPNTHQI